MTEPGREHEGPLPDGAPNPFSREAAEPTASPAPRGAPEPKASDEAPPGYPPTTPAYEPYPSNPYAANEYPPNPYEVNPYQPAYGGYSPYGAAPQPHPRATTAMILGFVGVALCAPVGIAALVLGSRARTEIDAEPGRYAGRGMATAGVALGIASIVIGAVEVLFFILVGYGSSLGS